MCLLQFLKPGILKRHLAKSLALQIDLYLDVSGGYNLKFQFQKQCIEL